MEGVVAVADLKAGGLPGAFDFDSAEFGLSSDRDSEGAVLGCDVSWQEPSGDAGSPLGAGGVGMQAGDFWGGVNWGSGDEAGVRPASGGVGAFVGSACEARSESSGVGYAEERARSSRYEVLYVYIYSRGCLGGGAIAPSCVVLVTSEPVQLRGEKTSERAGLVFGKSGV
jgi:hypothetical protein